MSHAVDYGRMRYLQRQLDLFDARAGHVLPFTRYTKPNYEVNWHHKLTCAYLDRFITKDIRFLMVFQPPRHGKSELTSRRLPALLHGLYPNDEILACSYNSELASDMTRDVQKIMDTPEYKEIFPRVQITPPNSRSIYKRAANEHELVPWQDPVSRLWQYNEGSYRSAGVGGSFTGRGGNWVLIDDPIKNREDADSKSFREMLKKFYRSTIRTRLEKNGSILITLTRWHEDDLAGWLLNLMKTELRADQFTVLELPAVREHLENPLDPRMIGDPLWPNKFDAAELMALEGTVGEREWNALYQQRPVTEGGNIVKRAQIQFYRVQPTRFDAMVQSWDFAVKDKETSDYAVGSVYGRLGTNIYLLGQIRGRWTFPVALQQVRALTLAYPGALAKLVESKAVGPAVVQTLKGTYQGFIEVEPKGDKVARLNAVAPLYQSAQIWYPDPSLAPWVEAHISEMCAFPNGANDDRVDAESQALDYLRLKAPLRMPMTGHGTGVVY